MLSLLGMLAALAAAQAASLPGIDLPFSVSAEGRWVLSDSLPAPYVQAGVQPGWVLTAVDGRVFSSPSAAMRQVADGPSREVQLLFQIPPPPPAPDAPPPTADAPPPTPEETILIVRRAELVYAAELGLLPWPEGFAPGSVGWQASSSGTPLLIAENGGTWTLDPATGAQERSREKPEESLAVPEVWWALTSAPWAIDAAEGVSGGDVAWAQQQLGQSIRLRSFQGSVGDHLAQITDTGLRVYQIRWPRGTPDLPVCSAQVPETCLTSGRQILETLAKVPGAKAEARRHLGLACAGGVYRGCYEAVALEEPERAVQAQACVEGDVTACHTVARERLAREPEKPGALTVGLLEFACQVDASGTLGERLRRLEDAGEGCMMLASAYDRLEVADRALLSLDQACVLGRADACDEAARRRHQAFALRTVRECESTDLPIASSCVDLGRLQQEETVAAATLDAFDAFLRGCSLGAEEGCILLGDYVDRWGIENERVLGAEAALLGACERGEQRACVGGAYLLVRHDPRSDAYAQALLTFDQACQGGLATACVAGARQRRIGTARRTEAPPQVEMWQAACDLSSTEGCAGLGNEKAIDKKTWAQAFDAWTRACDTGDAHSCTELGQLVLNKHKEPWPSEQPSDDYLQRGCDNGDPEGCFWLAYDELPRKGEPPEQAYLLLEQSCEGEYGDGCARLAEVHLDRRTSFDDEIAAGHLETACYNGHYDSCRELGNMFLRGKGVERDRDRARELMERFKVNANRKHVRLGAHIGFPYVLGAEAELVAPIPVGPAISIAGSYSYLPYLGTALIYLNGDSDPLVDPGFTYVDMSLRLYPNNKARGFYGGLGVHRITAEGGDLTEPLYRDGISGRVGIHSDTKGFYTRVELGIGQYGIIDINDFDEDEQGRFPLIQPTFGVAFGFAFR